MISVAALRRRLDAFELRSRDLVEACLAAAEESGGEGSRTFTRIDVESARRRADLVDARLRRGETVGALAGIPVSVKDLFDVAGERTTAGSLVLADAEPATDDAVVVRRLKEAGAVLIGRTNMTEFAYSGLGLNPHYGTPRNPYDRGTGGSLGDRLRARRFRFRMGWLRLGSARIPGGR